MQSINWTPAAQTDANANDAAWVIDPLLLKVGDVLVSTTENIVSTGIRFATRSGVSHAALHVGGGFVIEAVDAGVRRTHVRSLVYPKEQFITVLRPVNASDQQCLNASLHARSLLYRPYSMLGAIGTLAPFCRVPDDPGRFCSQLVSEAFARAGVALSEKSVLAITPSDILGSHALKPAKATRCTSKRAVLHALSEMQPNSTLQANGDTGRTPVTTEAFEAAALGRAETEMSKHSCFRTPYHFFDVLRQISEVDSANFAAAKAVDAVIGKVFTEFDAFSGGVEPRPTIPGLIGNTPDPGMPLIALFVHSSEEATEVLRLYDEILAARIWDMAEWQTTVDEFEMREKQSQLTSIGTTHFWLLGDLARVDLTYRWLAREN